MNTLWQLHRSTTQHGNVDAMSHLPLKVKPQDTPLPPEFILLLDAMSKGPVTCSQIRTYPSGLGRMNLHYWMVVFCGVLM